MNHKTNLMTKCTLIRKIDAFFELIPDNAHQIIKSSLEQLQTCYTASRLDRAIHLEHYSFQKPLLRDKSNPELVSNGLKTLISLCQKLWSPASIISLAHRLSLLPQLIDSAHRFQHMPFQMPGSNRRMDGL